MGNSARGNEARLVLYNRLPIRRFKGIHMSNTLKAFHDIEDAREHQSHKPSDTEFWEKSMTDAVDTALHAIEAVYFNLHDTQETQRDVLSPEQVQKIRDLLLAFDEWRARYYIDEWRKSLNEGKEESDIRLPRIYVVDCRMVTSSLVACLYFATAYNIPPYILSAACSTAAKAPEVLENLDKMSVEERIEYFEAATSGVGVFYSRDSRRRS